jgi:hypothetical protein
MSFGEPERIGGQRRVLLVLIGLALMPVAAAVALIGAAAAWGIECCHQPAPLELAQGWAAVASGFFLFLAGIACLLASSEARLFAVKALLAGAIAAFAAMVALGAADTWLHPMPVAIAVQPGFETGRGSKVVYTLPVSRSVAVPAKGGLGNAAATAPRRAGKPPGDSH